ncbi:MAG: c-type cytochrome [Rhodovibrio sp.]|nr:c-type cytochrome [Rhodovibrio sp.]
MIRTVLATAAFMLCLPVAAAQADDGDPAAGEKLARSACAMCHKLPDGSGATVGPAFPEIAGEQAPLSSDQLVEVLNQPQHAPAKTQVDLPADAADLAAYLNGLR